MSEEKKDKNVKKNEVTSIVFVNAVKLGRSTASSYQSSDNAMKDIKVKLESNVVIFESPTQTVIVPLSNVAYIIK